MDVQQPIDWDLSSLETHLRTVLREDSDVQLLLTIAREDRETADRQRRPAGSTTFARKTKRELGLASRHSPNAGRAALDRLAARGVLVYEISAAGHELLVDWQAVWRLAPRPTAEQRLRDELEASRGGGAEGGGQTAVRPGQGPPRVFPRQQKPVSSVDRVPCRGRLVRPWHRRDGLTGEDLATAVRERSAQVLHRLYWSGVEAGWWEDCEAYRQQFLACCWQAVASADSSPMGLLNLLVRRFLREAADGEQRRGLTNEADDWASETRRAWSRQRAEAEEVTV